MNIFIVGTYDNSNLQIMKEIDYSVKRYNLVPKVYIAYERYSYCDNEDLGLRITFDTNLRFRKEDLNLEYGSAGKLFFDENKYIMEIKTLGGLPIWFANVLSELKIYPTSFSKYGSIYKKYLKEKEKIEYV